MELIYRIVDRQWPDEGIKHRLIESVLHFVFGFVINLIGRF